LALFAVVWPDPARTGAEAGATDGAGVRARQPLLGRLALFAVVWPDPARTGAEAGATDSDDERRRSRWHDPFAKLCGLSGQFGSPTS
jgi:hypothetical protein